MKVSKIKNALALLGVNAKELSLLMGRGVNYVSELLKKPSDEDVSRPDELCIEALMHRKIEGNLWKGISD